MLKHKLITLMVGSSCILAASVYAQSDADLTPDQAAPLNQPSDSNPPAANNAVNDNAVLTAVQSTLSPVASGIKVMVKNGVVFFAGQLNSETDYENVVANAQAAPGVTDVNVDNLTVKDSQNPLTDTFITAKVKGSLLKSDILGKDIPSWSVHVETKDGQVYLSGTVASDAEKQNVLNVVKGVKGVTTINDQMVVSTTTE